MKRETKEKSAVFVYAVGIIGTFLIVGALILVMYYYTAQPGVDAARAAERTRNLKDLQAQTTEQLENYGWVDKTKGIVRLPIARAMELTAQEWKNPAAAKTNMLGTLEKLLAVPPAAPPPPNPYE